VTRNGIWVKAILKIKAGATRALDRATLRKPEAALVIVGVAVVMVF
jgi:hypothetical protein